MGSWSENCGLSGMEIGCGEVAYVGLLGRPKYAGHGSTGLYVPRSTFIRGTYDDYGYLLIDEDEAVLAAFNQQTGLKLENGENFELEHLSDVEGDVERLWIHGLTFDFAATIEPEFPYFGSTRNGKYESVKIKSIGEKAAMHVGEIRESVLESIAKINEFNGSSTGIRIAAARRALTIAKRLPNEVERDRHVAAITTIIRDLGGDASFTSWLARNALRDLMGSEVCGRIGYQTPVSDAITDARPFEGLLEAYRRGFIVECAFGELRRKMVPSEHCGPQHGGHVASLQFAKFLIAAQKERSDRWEDDEDEGDDE